MVNKKQKQIKEKWMRTIIGITLGVLFAIASTGEAAKYKIAVVDSGFNTLEYFSDDIPICAKGHYNFITKRNDLGYDTLGHGTIVTKLINDQITDKKKICYMVYKIFSGPFTNDDLVASAIVKAVRRGARVINLSLGGPVKSYNVEKALRYAGKRGVRVFVAAGNESSNLNYTCSTYPACIKMKHVKTVGAVDYKTNGPAFYSNYGVRHDLWEDGAFGSMNGTSFATPRALGRYVESVVNKK